MNFTKWFVPFVLLLCILLDNLLNNFRSSIWTKQTLAKNIKRIIDLTQKKQKTHIIENETCDKISFHQG